MIIIIITESNCILRNLGDWSLRHFHTLLFVAIRFLKQNKPKKKSLSQTRSEGGENQKNKKIKPVMSVVLYNPSLFFFSFSLLFVCCIIENVGGRWHTVPSSFFSSFLSFELYTHTHARYRWTTSKKNKTPIKIRKHSRKPSTTTRLDTTRLGQESRQQTIASTISFCLLFFFLHILNVFFYMSTTTTILLL